MRKNILAILSLGAISAAGLNAADAATYYLSTAGQDNPNKSGSANAPFATFWYAQKFLTAGDTLIVKSGTYSRSSGNDFVITVSGNDTSGDITFLADPAGPTRPVIVGNNTGSAITIGGSHIVVSGFNATAGDSNSSYTLSAIQIGNGSPIHHVKVMHNQAYHSGCAGIQSSHADYLTIERNSVFRNSSVSEKQCSGIDIGFGSAYDTKAGYHNYIIANWTFENTNVTPVTSTSSDPHNGHTTDGSGIILDTFNTNGYSGGATLIMSNVSYANGGSGIRVFQSTGVDVINNTVYGNNQDANQYTSATSAGHGEIYVTTATDVHTYNNIAVVASPKLTATYALLDRDTNGGVYDHNCIVGGTQQFTLSGYSYPSWQYQLEQDPQFVKPSLDPSVANFALQSTSPALNAGDYAYIPAAPYNVDLNLQSFSNPPNMGAY